MSKNKARCAAKKLDDGPRFCWQRRGLISLSSVMLFVFFFSGLYFSWRWINQPGRLPFKTLQVVTHAKYIKSGVLQRLVQENLTGGFFDFDERAVRAALLTNPWVKSVGMRRVFPSTLVLNVEEYQPVAFWQDGWVLTSSGALITASRPPELSLPYLSGPEGSVAEVYKEYLSLSRIVAPLHLFIASIMLTDRHAWYLKLSSGTEVVLGREEVLSRFGRFVSVYPKIMARHSGFIRRVDLRYGNGLAVSWGGSV